MTPTQEALINKAVTLAEELREYNDETLLGVQLVEDAAEMIDELVIAWRTAHDENERDFSALQHTVEKWANERKRRRHGMRTT